MQTGLKQATAIRTVKLCRMAHRIYYERDLRERAWARTEIKWLRNITISFLAGLGVWALTGANKIEILFLTWLFAAAMFFVVECFAYAYRRFYVAPFAVHQEQADRIVNLESELGAALAARLSIQERKQLAADLSSKSEAAVHQLWTSNPQTDAQVDTWLAAINQWHQETLQIMQAGGCTEPEIRSVRALGNLTEFNPFNRRYSSNGRIQRGKIMIDGYRQRLKPIIERYDAD